MKGGDCNEWNFFENAGMRSVRLLSLGVRRLSDAVSERCCGCARRHGARCDAERFAEAGDIARTLQSGAEHTAPSAAAFADLTDLRGWRPVGPE